MDPVKLVAAEIALTTANTVGLATVVRICNNSGGTVLLTRANTGGTVGTATIINGDTEYFEKVATDTFAANAAVRAVAVAYR